MYKVVCAAFFCFNMKRLDIEVRTEVEAEAAIKKVNIQKKEEREKKKKKKREKREKKK